MSTVITDAFRVQTRTEFGKGASRNDRINNMVPGIIYGDNKDNVCVKVDIRDIEKGLHQTNFFTSVYEFPVNKQEEKVLVQKIEFHPVTDRPIHIDFKRISKGAKIHINVPVTFKNQDQAPGIKKGGLLNIIIHSLEVTCMVENIPGYIEIDLKGYEIGDSILTKDIDLGKSIVATHPERDTTFASIVAPIAESTLEESETSTESQ